MTFSIYFNCLLKIQNIKVKKYVKCFEKKLLEFQKLSAGKLATMKSERKNRKSFASLFFARISIKI